MKTVKFIPLLLLLLAFSQCKKEHRYPDDPKKSRKTPNERLKGWWYIEEYTLDGVSIIDTMNKVCGCDLRNDVVLTYNMLEDSDHKKFWILGIKYPKYFGMESKTAFSDYHHIELGPAERNNGLELFYKLFITPFRVEYGAIARWEVTKLFESELHIQLRSNLGIYKLKYLKSED